MAVDVYSENFIDIISPRLSFSRDLEENDISTSSINDFSCKMDQSLVDSTFDFAFNVDTSIRFPSSSADELFSDGIMLPTSLKNEEIQVIEVLPENPIRPCLDPLTTITEVRKKSLKEFLEDSIEEDEPNNVGSAKSFWKFRRSNSLNCYTNQRKGIIGSWKILSRSGSTGKFLEKIMEEEEKPTNNLHIKILGKFTRINSLKCEKFSSGNEIPNKNLIGSSKILRRSQSTSDHDYSKSDSKHFRRSNSTGSAPNTTNGNKLKKQQSLKQQQHQHQVVGNGKVFQKGKVKDNFRGYSYGNTNNNISSLRINPVLNLPSPNICRVSVDLFSFGSLFCNGAKDRKKKK